MNKLPDNVIQFPVMERVKQVINEKIDNEIERYETEQDIKEECVELAHYCFQLRYKGMKHPFQETLDNANDKLNELLLECEDDFD